jgi:hypothetical protein
MIWYELQLPVYKQGDDLDVCLRKCDGNVTRALRKQAAYYRDAALALEQIASHRRADELEISAMTHSITVDGPDDLLEELVAVDLLQRHEDVSNDDADVDGVFVEQRDDGWYYCDENYPEEGYCGPFCSEEAAIEHAADGGYVVEKKL